jgi:hypothetical protein
VTTRTLIAARVRVEDLLTEQGGPYRVEAKAERGGLVILTLLGLDYAYDPTEPVEVQRP